MSKPLLRALCLCSLLLLIPIPDGAEALRYPSQTYISTVDASFVGTNYEEALGSDVAVLGDINGDGFDDLAISAMKQGGSGTGVGRVWIFLGNETRWTKNMALASADASLVSVDTSSKIDLMVSRAGDVNGDGYSDFIVGEPTSDTYGRNTGTIYLFLGMENGWKLGIDLQDANATFHGEEGDDFAGIFVSHAGDVNGDGLDDFLIGAYGNDEAFELSGQCYLVLGKRSGWAKGVDLSNASASFHGERYFSHLGQVSSAGDVNGDHYDDFLVVALYDGEHGTTRGQAYLFLGRPTGWKMDTSASEANASFYGEADGDQAGRGIGCAGDVNGDGLDDIVVGAYRNDDLAGEAGKVYLILGKRSGWQMDVSLADVDATLPGPYSNEQVGHHVVGVGDVDGDGLDDFMVSGHTYGALPGTPGRVFLILGRETGWTEDMDLVDSSTFFIGEGGGSWIGHSFDGNGDINGDGYDDVVVGSRGLSTTNTNAGKAYLIFPDHNARPTTYTELDLYRGNFTYETGAAYINDTITVVLQADDGNPSRRDVAEVRVSNPDSTDRSFLLRLLETNVSSGLYTGNFTIKDRTHERYHWIEAKFLDRVLVRVVDPLGPSQSLWITKPPVLQDMPPIVYAQEDQNFSLTFNATDGQALLWSYDSNTTWLILGYPGPGVIGSPNNTHVGSYWLNVTAMDAVGGTDWVNVTIIVNNTAPIILTNDTISASQDAPFMIDYDSDDDGQGNVTWHLNTTATWLSINESTGVLWGTPSKFDVGEVNVTVSVDDGNDGWSNTSFVLTVGDVPDAPEILTTPPKTTLEDEEYNVSIEVADPDIGEVLTWNTSSLPHWLTFNEATRILSGVPENDDVGDHDIRISVTDRTGSTAWLIYNLTVVNVVDPPEITTIDVMTATEDILYEVFYSAMDDDLDDVLIWLFSTDSRWLEFDNSTGRLYGTPRNSEDGTFFVNITVMDSWGAFDTNNFTLTVNPVNDAPWFYSVPRKEAFVLVNYEYWATARDVDSGGSFSWKLDEAPEGMSIAEGTGIISWVPRMDQLGQHSVVVNVSDGDLWALQEYSVTVTGVPGNNEPVISSQPPKTDMKVGGRFSYTVGATDGDEDTLTYELNDSPLGMTIDASTGEIDWTPGSGDVGTHNVSIRVHDGKGGQTYQNFTLIVDEADVPNGNGHEEPDEFNWLPIILLILIVAALGGVAYWMMRSGTAGVPSAPVIDDIFLVYRDGRLIHHKARRLRPDVDDSLLTSMLTAVQGFISDSVGQEVEQTVNEIRYGDGRILIEHGEYVFLSVFVQGEATEELHGRMQHVIEEMEMEHFHGLADWSGDVSDLKGISKWLDGENL